MMRAVLADSGPLYAVADEGDAHHEHALQQFHTLAGNKIEVLIPYPTLLETYSLVLFRIGTEAAIRWLAYMVDAAFVSPTPDDYRQAFAKVRALPDQRLTLVDATIGALALRLGLEVWTYDHHFDVMRIPVWR